MNTTAKKRGGKKNPCANFVGRVAGYLKKCLTSKRTADPDRPTTEAAFNARMAGLVADPHVRQSMIDAYARKWRDLFKADRPAFWWKLLLAMQGKLEPDADPSGEPAPPPMLYEFDDDDKARPLPANTAEIADGIRVLTIDQAAERCPLSRRELVKMWAAYWGEPEPPPATAEDAADDVGYNPATGHYQEQGKVWRKLRVGDLVEVDQSDIGQVVELANVDGMVLVCLLYSFTSHSFYFSNNRYHEPASHLRLIPPPPLPVLDSAGNLLSPQHGFASPSEKLRLRIAAEENKQHSHELGYLNRLAGELLVARDDETFPDGETPEIVDIEYQRIAMLKAKKNFDIFRDVMMDLLLLKPGVYWVDGVEAARLKRLITFVDEITSEFITMFENETSRGHAYLLERAARREAEAKLKGRADE